MFPSFYFVFLLCIELVSVVGMLLDCVECGVFYISVLFPSSLYLNHFHFHVLCVFGLFVVVCLWRVGFPRRVVCCSGVVLSAGCYCRVLFCICCCL